MHSKKYFFVKSILHVKIVGTKDYIIKKIIKKKLFDVFNTKTTLKPSKVFNTKTTLKPSILFDIFD